MRALLFWGQMDLINSYGVEKRRLLKAAGEQKKMWEWPSMEKNSKWVFMDLDSRTTEANMNFSI